LGKKVFEETSFLQVGPSVEYIGAEVAGATEGKPKYEADIDSDRKSNRFGRQLNV